MSLKSRIEDDMKSALRGGDKPRLSTLRMAIAAIKQREIDERKDLTEADVIGVIEKMIKQRQESLAQFESAARTDLADKERGEIELLSTYLPRPLSDAELERLIDESIAAERATSIRDMGKVMARIKSQAAGRIDMGQVGARVKARLS